MTEPTKWTMMPGPYYAIKEQPNKRVGIFMEGLRLATIDIDFPDEQESAKREGTAVLFAASWDLAEALASALRVFDHVMTGGDVVSEAEGNVSERARAALRKAGVR